MRASNAGEYDYGVHIPRNHQQLFRSKIARLSCSAGPTVADDRARTRARTVPYDPEARFAVNAV